MDTTEEVKHMISDFLKQLLSFMKRESDICPHCGQPVESLDQVQRSVYANPCGCRVYQGLVPDEWKGVT